MNKFWGHRSNLEVDEARHFKFGKAIDHSLY